MSSKSSVERMRPLYGGLGISARKTKRKARETHCLKCTQCDYWLAKAKAYERKIDRHLDKGGQRTANFNSNENLHAPQHCVMNGT